ncbi:PAS domain S-box-containing protein [Azospirillum brasilense]|uniref:histidine kinase n=1 Tax=Azospirillum brasilense TaxID=192 RepID=A0A560BG48_AZOBR|nr:response regulator [Azospirillum brasilense]TWA71479.1 PAS domain S-box-containing protein [Azospirillum brasilense]
MSGNFLSSGVRRTGRAPVMDDAFLTAEGPAAVPRTRLRTLLTTIVGVITLFGVGLWGAATWADRDEAVSHARDRTLSAARLLHEHVRRTVATSDLVLQRVDDRLRTREMDTVARDLPLWQELRAMADAMPEVSAIWIHDAAGNGLLTTRQFPTPPMNATDRAFFQAHRNGEAFHIGGMIRGRLSGKPTFTISRRVGTVETFQGAANIAVDLDYFRFFFEGLNIGREGAVAVYREDGTLLFSLSGQENSGSPPAASPEAPSASPSAAPSGVPANLPPVPPPMDEAPRTTGGTIFSRSPVDGSERIVANLRVQDLPLIVQVGMSQDEALTPWRERTIHGGLLVLLAVAACAALAAAAARSLSREEVGRRRLAETNADLDATARSLEQANRAFAGANRRLNLILQSASEGICGVDRDERITFANPAACALTGYSNEEMLGRSLHVLLHHTRADGTPAPTIDCPVFEVLRTGEARGGSEDIYWRKDGTSFPVEFAASPMLEDGRVEGAVVVFHEIAERKRAEEALRQSKSVAEAASRAKSEFLANMSHEIRTPMNAILGLVHLIQQTDLSSRQRDYAQKIRVSAQSLLGILNDILDFSKVEAGKLELERVEFRLDDLLQNLAVIVGAAAQDKDIEVLFSVGPEVPLDLVGDPLRLQQVLINLAGNAIKFTDAGEVVVSVRAVEVAEERTVLAFSIRDTGIGIDSEQKERLFQAFSQADSSTTRRYGGTGLGLAICTRLVALMGGVMDVSSEPGQGSDFHFTAVFGNPAFGLAGLAGTGRMGAGRAGERPLRSRVVPRGLSVLVVDDNLTAREVLGELVTSFGWKTSLCASGAEAIAELERATAADQPYDIVLMDWKMPGMDGLETSRRIRDDGLVKAPVIIVVSAFGRERMGAGAGGEGLEELGLGGALVKPVTASSLLDAVIDAYGRGTGGDAAEATPSHACTAHPAGFLRPQQLRPLFGQRLLLVEDNSISQEVAREILERAGARVALAGNGYEAIARVEEADPPFDLVLMDVQMPEMDGFEATRRLRARPAGQGLPIIAMTASALPSDRQRCLDGGMDDHIAKPIDVEQLFSVVTRWLGQPAGGMSAGGLAAGAPLLPKPMPSAARAALPAELPGIDVKDALHRLDGDVGLFRKFVTDFARTYDGVADGIAVALAAGDLPRAKALGHELKSLAGNIGARTLSAAADAVQVAAFRGDGAAAAAQLPVLRAELEAVLDSAARLAVAPGRAQGGVPGDVSGELGGVGVPAVDIQTLEPMLDRFARLLRDSNFAAAEEFAVLAPLLADWIDPVSMKALSSAVDGLDFTKAQGILRRIMLDLGLSLPAD